MDAFHFDRLIGALTAAGSRRQVILALLAGVAGVGVSHPVAAGPACKDVGSRCKRAKDCCSGVCTGKKGKKRCKGHDSGGCQAGATSAICAGTATTCTTKSGAPGTCATTTGNAGYCAADTADCFACTKDAECQAFCGPRAACVRCPEECTVGTACMGAEPGACPVMAARSSLAPVA